MNSLQDQSGKLEENSGKPDSTTSTPANVSELASDLKEAEHKHRSPDVSIAFCLKFLLILRK